MEKVIVGFTKETDHCDRLYWLAEKDMPERGVVKGEPYCQKCPGIPLIGTHCCLAMKCKDRIETAKKRFKENWDKNVIAGFTKEYRDANWKKCRFGLDPRSCGRWELRGGKWFWAGGCFATRKRDSDGELHNYCMRDDKPCDAKWEE